MQPNFDWLCIWFSIILGASSRFLDDYNRVEPESNNGLIPCLDEIARNFFVRRENVLIISTSSSSVAGGLIRLMEPDFAINLATKHSQIDFSAVSDYIMLADEDMTDAYDAVRNMSLNLRGRYVIGTRNEPEEIGISAEKFWNGGIPNVIFVRPLNDGNATVFGSEIASRPNRVNATVVLRVLDHWKGKLTEKNDLFPNKFTNMHKHPLKTSAILKIWWSSFVDHEPEDKERILMSTKVLIEFANKLNFTLVHNTYRIPYKTREDSVWMERVDHLFRRQLDFVVALVEPSSALAQILDFSSPFKTSQLVFIMRTRQRIVSWNSMFKTFSTELWTFLLLALVAGLCLAMVVNRLWTTNVLKEYIRPIDVLKVYFAQSVVYPKHNGLRLAFALWMLYALLMTASFTGSLLDYLSAPNFQRDPQTIEELLHSKVMVNTNPKFRKLLLGLSDPTLRTLGVRTQTKLNFDEQVQDVWANGTASIMTDTFVLLLNSLKRHNESEQIRIIRGNIMEIPHFYYTWKGHPYREPLDRFIEQMKSAGIIDKWVLDHHLLPPKERLGSESEAVVLTLKHLASVFLVLTCGCGVGIITFFFELYHARQK